MKKILLLALLLTAGLASAETRYVTDQLKITMRSGESNKHRIIKMLPSGTPVTVLSDNKATGYSKVQLANGKTGYVLTRQLLKEPVARDRLAAMEKRIKELEASPNELSKRLAALSREHDDLKRRHTELQAEKDRIRKELDTLKRTAANAVQIAQERKKLRKQVATMSRELADQEQEIRELKNSTTQRWFLIGSGVLFGGILLGLVLPHLRVRKRKDSWGSL
ncbi:MAG TPA: TIGR04211 family SH3 domain-containing protein [Thiolapillus brandeum]|uniref:TIGR04211 family SH3 domain-containing protein n=1 Tax=Thiolapillus brandeum TaxID=1076588 RepID=A0A7C5N821_9GAMM|nr:TIGR04211 family SH3 domain-containing protein [Thiolapillus brandeum]